jgi:hypothetical protein
LSLRGVKDKKIKKQFFFYFQELNPINKRVDVGLSDQDLVLESTKSLNNMIKEKGITKDRATEIKQERRTLKNRYLCETNWLISDFKTERLDFKTERLDFKTERLKDLISRLSDLI